MKYFVLITLLVAFCKAAQKDCKEVFLEDKLSFERLQVIYKISAQNSEQVQEFKIEYSDEELIWREVKSENGLGKIFYVENKVEFKLETPIIAKVIVFFNS